MNKNLIKRWTKGLHDLRSDERGAESSEVILVLVLLVLGLIGAFAFLKNKLAGQSSKIGSCIGSADTAETC